MSGSEELLLRIRRAIKDGHSLSDALVMTKLARALKSREDYAEALALMGPVYFELQDLLWEVREKHSLLMEAAKMWKEYDRAGAFKRDIAAILGEGWEDKVQRPAPLEKYLKHLRKLAKKNPTTLLTYAWAMGSALALGGQTLKNRVIQALDRPGQPPVPTSIFEYAGGDGAISAVKARFKSLMLRACEGPDALSATQQDAIVREAPEVFRRNCAVVSTYSASVLDILRVVSASVFTPGFLSLIAAIAAAGIVVAGVVFFLRRGGIIGSPLHGAAPAPSSEGAVGGGGATHEPRLGEPVEL